MIREETKEMEISRDNEIVRLREEYREYTSKGLRRFDFNRLSSESDSKCIQPEPKYLQATKLSGQMREKSLGSYPDSSNGDMLPLQNQIPLKEDSLTRRTVFPIVRIVILIIILSLVLFFMLFMSTQTGQYSFEQTDPESAAVKSPNY